MHLAPDTHAFLITEAIAAIAFLIWAVCLIALCVGLS